MACYAFQKGNCRRGGRCRFSHDSGESDSGGRGRGYRGGRAGNRSRGGRGGEDYHRGVAGDDGYRARAGVDGGYRDDGRRGESDRYSGGARIDSGGYRSLSRVDRGDSRGFGERVRDDYRSSQRSIAGGNRGGRIGSRSYRDAGVEYAPAYLGPGGRENSLYMSRERATSGYGPAFKGGYRDRGEESSRGYRVGEAEGEDVYRRGVPGRSPGDGNRDRAFRGDIRYPEDARVNEGAYLGGGRSYRDEREDRGYQTGGGGGFNLGRDPGGRGPYRDSAPPPYSPQQSYEPPIRGRREGGRYSEKAFGGPSRFDFQNDSPQREGSFRFSPENSGRGRGARRRGGGDRGRGVCYAWQRGNCTRGGRCKFSHGGDRERSRSESRQQTRGSKACHQDGIISTLNDKGYGFIKLNSGGSLFFHSNAMSERGTFDDLREGDRVSFETGLDTKTGRDRAENVLLLR